MRCSYCFRVFFQALQRNVSLHTHYTYTQENPGPFRKSGSLKKKINDENVYL